MKIVYFKDFVKNGEFDSIKIGSTKSDVIKLLGKSDDIADCGETKIIRYGWYEFFYWTKSEKIFGIQNDHLQADCTNHSEMINFKNRKWKLENWFLEIGKNQTFKNVKDLLNSEKIEFNVQKPYENSDYNIIKCVKSNVTIDFADEYRIVELKENGKFKQWKEIKVENEDDYVLNGIRLFDI